MKKEIEEKIKFYLSQYESEMERVSEFMKNMNTFYALQRLSVAVDYVKDIVELIMEELRGGE